MSRLMAYFGNRYNFLMIAQERIETGSQTTMVKKYGSFVSGTW